MKRRRRSHARYGLPAPRDYRFGYDVDPRHAYRDILRSLDGNGGHTRSTWRMWMQQRGVPKAVTDRALSLMERRSHVVVHSGRYYITVEGLQAIHPEARG